MINRRRGLGGWLEQCKSWLRGSRHRGLVKIPGEEKREGAREGGREWVRKDGREGGSG